MSLMIHLLSFFHSLFTESPRDMVIKKILDLWLYGVHMNVLTTERHQYTPFFKFKSSNVKGLVQPKMKIKSLITHPHTVPTL